MLKKEKNMTNTERTGKTQMLTNKHGNNSARKDLEGRELIRAAVRVMTTASFQIFLNRCSAAAEAVGKLRNLKDRI